MDKTSAMTESRLNKVDAWKKKPITPKPLKKKIVHALPLKETPKLPTKQALKPVLPVKSKAVKAVATPKPIKPKLETPEGKLMTEAKKYKTADEFVKSKGDI